MLIFTPQVAGGLQLEDGLGNLLLENGDTLVLENFTAELAVQVLDEAPVLPIPYRYHLPYLFFEPEEAGFATFYDAWQNPPTTLMPEYSSEYLYGAVHNFPYFFMQLAPPIFPVDGTRVASPTNTRPGFLGVGRAHTTRRPA